MSLYKVVEKLLVISKLFVYIDAGRVAKKWTRAFGAVLLRTIGYGYTGRRLLHCRRKLKRRKTTVFSRRFA